MSLPEFHPPVFDKKPERLTTRKLISEANALASNNPRFRRQQMTKLQFGLTETDVLVPLKYAFTGEYDEDDESEDLGGMVGDEEIAVTYEFIAERFSGENDRTHIAFDFSVTAALHNTDLPSYIAESEFGVAPEDVDYEVGKVIKSQRAEFAISTFDRQIHANESLTYVHADDESEVILYASNDDEDGTYDPVYYLRQVPSDDDIDVSQLISNKAAHRLEREKLVVATPEEALELWVGTMSLHEIDRTILEDRYDANLALAFGTLRAIKRVLVEQAGSA